MLENDDLVEVLLEQTGLSDIFGYQPGPCQAVELWRIRTERIQKIEMEKREREKEGKKDER